MMNEHGNSPSTFSLLDVVGNGVLSSDRTLASEDTDSQDSNPKDSILYPKSEGIEEHACNATSPTSHPSSSPDLEKGKDELTSEAFTKESLDRQKDQSGSIPKLRTGGDDVTTVQGYGIDGSQNITALGNDKQPLDTSDKDGDNDHRDSPGKNSEKIQKEHASGTCGPPGKPGKHTTYNTQDKVELRSNSTEGDVAQTEDHSRQNVEKIPEQPNGRDHTNVTLMEGADQIKDDGNHISGQQANVYPSASKQDARETANDVGDENGAKKTAVVVDQEKNMTSSRSTIGRVIMIDGIKFVAVTCLQPPKGHCRTCNTFGPLLYFSARTCYVLEAAEKFCSVQCARKFINQKQCRPTPSRQPSGNVGYNVSVSKLEAPKDQRDKRDAGYLSKLTSSRANDVKRKKGLKSKRASRNAEILENIYVDSLVINKVDKPRSPKKMANQRNLKKQGTYRSLTPPLPRQLDESTLKMASKSETSVVERSPKAFDKRLTATSCEEKAIDSECKEMESASKQSGKRKKKTSQDRRSSAEGEPPAPPGGNKVNTTPPGILSRPKREEGQKKRLSFPPIMSTVWKQDDLRSMFRTIGSKRRQARKMSNVSSSSGTSSVKRCTLQQCHQPGGSTKRSNEREGMATVRASNKPLRNLTKGSPSRSSTKLWKKYGKNFQSQSCEFHPQDLMRVSRECDIKEPTSKGLIGTRKKETSRRNVDTRMSLNQFHERRRSLFKTMFPFQDILGQPKGAQGSGKATFPGEKTPRETSVAEDCGDVATLATAHTMAAPETPNPILGVSEMAGKAKGRGYSGRTISQRIRNEDKPSTDKQRSNWSNLFQYMMDAADREEAERRKKYDSDEDHCATSTGPSVEDFAISRKTGTTDKPYPQFKLSSDKTKGKILDNPNGQEKIRMTKKKKKKKKKKRKRKKGKRSRHKYFQDVGMRRHLQKKQREAQAHCMRKGKDKKRRGRHVSESPSSPESSDDPDAWPKWRGDGKIKTDMMTSIDHLIWTMKNKFQPDIGQSRTVSGNANLSTNSIISS